MTLDRTAVDGRLAGDVGTADRVRARYAKTGRLRFVSAIDLSRVWERALRKAGLPIAYSEGFTPHPKVSFPDALPLGYASTGEYAEIGFAEPITIGPAMRALNDAFAGGCEVLDARGVLPGERRLSKWLGRALWCLSYPPEADRAALTAAAEAVLAADRWPVPRERKGEVTEVDLRAPLVDLAVSDEDAPRVAALLDASEPPLRPTEVHAGLAAALSTTTAPHTDHSAAAGSTLPKPRLISRTAQGAPADGGLREALSGEHLAVTAAFDATREELRLDRRDPTGA